MRDHADLVTRIEALLAEIDALDAPVRRTVIELLDGVDALHRPAVERLAGALDAQALGRLRAREPAVAWLLDAYGVGADDHTAAEAALEAVRPYIRSHGGDVHVLAARGGVVRVRLSGACSGCTASAVTLAGGVEQALRERLPGFVALEVEEDLGAPHPPPAAALLDIEPLSA